MQTKQMYRSVLTHFSLVGLVARGERRSARGLGLIELIVGLAIGSLVIAGAIDLYARLYNTYSLNESRARLQENAGYALASIEADVHLAGYWGLTNKPRSIAGTVGNTPLALPASARSCGNDFAIDLGKPVDAANAGYTLACAPGPSGSAAQAQADTLIIRRANTQASSADGARLQLYTNRRGDLNRVFLSGSAPGAITVDPVNGPVAEIHNLIVRAYYVSRSSSQPGIPSLRRKTLVGGPQFQDEEIVQTIEDMQVQLGIDPGLDADRDGVADDLDANGRPDRYDGVASLYVNPGDARLATALVVSVRVWLRVRAETPEAGFVNDTTYSYGDVTFQPNDAFRRLLVSRTFYVHNSRTL